MRAILSLSSLLVMAAVVSSETAYQLNNQCQMEAVEIPQADVHNYTDPGRAAMFNEGLFQGDIAGGMGIVQNENGTSTLAAIYPGGSWDFWPYGIVHYEFHSSVSASHRALIQNTLNEMTSATNSCLRFVNRNGCSGIRNYILVRSDVAGCWSYVGRNRNGNQELSLQANGCMWKSTIMHEFMHAIGMHHEQCRPDRDNFVRLHLQNLSDQKWAYAFDKLTNTNTYGIPYDIRSLMHYGSTAFARPGLNTITPIGIYAGLSLREIGSRQTLGATSDVRLIKSAYRCK